MIDLAAQRIGILTPPKCGTHTLHAVFCTPPWNGQAIVGPTASDPARLDRHVRAWPCDLEGYRRLVVVRHPLDRLVSLFLHFVRFEASEGRGTPCFADFARWVAGPDRPPEFEPQLFYRWNLVTWLAAAEWDAVLKVESLAEDLRREGLVVATLPREYASFRPRPWPAFYTPELLDAVRPWAQPDCERFGYSAV